MPICVVAAVSTTLGGLATGCTRTTTQCATVSADLADYRRHGCFELRELGIDKLITLAAQLVGLSVGCVDDAVCFLVCSAHDLGLADKAVLLGQCLINAAFVVIVTAGDQTLGFSLCTGLHSLGFATRVIDDALCLILGVRHHRGGTSVRIFNGQLGLVFCLCQCLFGFSFCVVDQCACALGRFVDDLVLVVENVLGVIELCGQCVAEIVEQQLHLVAGNHAVGGHWNAVSLVDDLDHFV